MIAKATVHFRRHGSDGSREILEDVFRRLEAVHRDAHLSDELRWFAREYMLRLKPIMGGNFSAATEDDLLKLILNATPIANLADNAVSSPISTIDFALHTADPGSGGDMTTSEITYTGYARVSVARTSGALPVTGNNANPAASITFPIGQAGSTPTATYASCGYPGGGAKKILMSGVLQGPINCGLGITPLLTTASLFTIN